MFQQILQYGFLLIFFCTAFIGLASLVGWVPKLDDWYKKRIFTALILEVVAVILLLFKDIFLDRSGGIPDYSINTENWVALEENGTVVQPEVILSTNDTTIRWTLGKPHAQGFTDLDLDFSAEQLKVLNGDKEVLAGFPKNELEQLGFFNSIRNEENEISSMRNHQYVKWRRVNKPVKSNWIKRGRYLAPYYLQVYDEAGETKYRIGIENSEEVIFKSDQSSKNLFNVDNRITHFFKTNGIYHLLRVNEADLKNDSINYVHILHVTFEPIIQ